MGKGPKKEEYKPTENEKMQASIALKEKEDFKRLYGPLLREMRDLAETEDFTPTATGIANADTMIALTAKPSIQATRSVDAAADVASAGVAQIGKATSDALAAKRERQVGVLGTSRQQQADATTGLGRIARMEATKSLQEAKDNQMLRDARTAAGIRIATTAGSAAYAKSKGLGGEEFKLFQDMTGLGGGLFKT